MNQQLASPAAPKTPAPAIRVLVVDDSALARAALVRLLSQQARLQVAGQAEGGPEGLALAARLQPDLVLTDLHMAEVDGLQLVSRLRETHPAVKAIVTSAHDGPTLHAISLQHGAAAFIPKQRLPAELPGVLDRLFPESPKDEKL